MLDVARSHDDVGGNHRATTLRERLRVTFAYLQLAVGAGLILVVITRVLGGPDSAQLLTGVLAAGGVTALKGFGLLGESKG